MVMPRCEADFSNIIHVKARFCHSHRSLHYSYWDPHQQANQNHIPGASGFEFLFRGVQRILPVVYFSRFGYRSLHMYWFRIRFSLLINITLIIKAVHSSRRTITNKYIRTVALLKKIKMKKPPYSLSFCREFSSVGDSFRPKLYWLGENTEISFC